MSRMDWNAIISVRNDRIKGLEVTTGRTDI